MKSFHSPLDVSIVNELCPHVIVKRGGACEGRYGDHDLRDVVSIQVETFDHTRSALGIDEEGLGLVSWRQKDHQWKPAVPAKGEVLLLMK